MTIYKLEKDSTTTYILEVNIGSFWLDIGSDCVISLSPLMCTAELLDSGYTVKYKNIL